METERERERANQMAEGHLAQEKEAPWNACSKCKRISGPLNKLRSMRLCVLQILVYPCLSCTCIRSYPHLLIIFSCMIMTHGLQEDCPSNVSSIEGRRNIGRSPSAQKRRANGIVSKLRTHVSTPPLFERFNEVLVKKRRKGLTAYVNAAMHMNPRDLGSWSSQLGSTIQWSKQA